MKASSSSCAASIFIGNTTTRDKVIRREILLDEGDIYSGRLWDASILRLNQLGYFEPLKENESYDIKRNPNSNTVDIELKLKEKGKNSIGLNGGVSGISGTFVGANYSTNNFLGQGETLSLESQLGTTLRSVNLGFTEPYFLDTRPAGRHQRLYPALQLRPGAASFHSERPEPDPVLQLPGQQQSAELRSEFQGRVAVAELPHQAQLRPLLDDVRVRYLGHHPADHRRH